MAEFSGMELTDEEIANANTVIIVDSHRTQSQDTTTEENILDDAVRVEKKNTSYERKSDSQSTYLSTNSVDNNTDEHLSFSLSDMSEELDSINNSQSEQQNDAENVASLCPAVDGPRDSSIENRFQSCPPHLSSTPLVHSISSRLKHKPEMMSDSKEGDFCVNPMQLASSSTRTPVRRTHVKNSSDESVVPAKRIKTVEGCYQSSMGDEKVEHELQEYTLTLSLVGSVTFTVDKSSNQIYSACLKQLSLAEDFDDGSGVAGITSEAEYVVKPRLSGGSTSDSSGNLADRSLTASSVSVPGSFELPQPYNNRASNRGISSTNIDSMTSTSSSSLTSVCRQNLARYLDVRYSRHASRDHQTRNFISKLCCSQQIKFSCPECGHIFPPLEVSSAVDCPVTSNVTPEIMSGNFNDSKTLSSSAGHKICLDDHKLGNKEKDNDTKLKDLPLIEIMGARKSPIVTHRTTPFKAGASKNRSVKGLIISRDNSCKTKEGKTPELNDPSSESCKTEKAEFKSEPSTSKGDRSRVCLLKREYTESSSNLSSDSNNAASSILDSSFIDPEDFVLPEGVKGKAGPRHRSKQDRNLSSVEEEQLTMLLGDGKVLPYPPSDSRIFENCNFLFTYSQSNWEKNKKNYKLCGRSFSGSETDDRSNNGDFSSGFPSLIDPQKLMDLVKYGGGRVYKILSEVPFDELENTYLIASHPCRTVKYLRCLVAGIARYDQATICQCCIERVPFKKFVKANACQLPTGWSEELREVVLEQECRDPLKGCAVLLALTKSYFNTSEINFWEEVLIGMEASVVKLKQTQGPFCLDSFKVIVTDNSCSDGLVAEAIRDSKPLVNCNWIIHTLIHGKYRDPDACPTYKYTYAPD